MKLYKLTVTGFSYREYSMLQQLAISNFAIVKSLDIDWRQGMTTITGETGAGKSIAIDALGLCLGERATTNTVRPNTDKAQLSASFDVTNNAVAKVWLQENDLLADNECIIRRTIFMEGRSRAYINGVQVPVAQLKQLGQRLINIHGQHDHQLLLKPSEQLRLVDAYADHIPLLDAVKYQFQQWKKLTLEFQQLNESISQRNAQQQLLSYQVNELDEFALADGEFIQLEQDYKRHSNAQQLITETHQALYQLSDDEQTNALSLLQRSADSLSNLAECDEQLAPIAAILAEAIVQIEEASNDLRHYVDKLELDPETYAQIEERYSTAMLLAKKHQILPENLTSHHANLAKELSILTSSDDRLDALVLEIEQAKNDYISSAQELSKSRQTAANKLSKLISTSMHELNMPEAQFKVEINQSPDLQFSSHGFDNAVFNVSMNPGQPLEAMHKVASGGELSRISLAIQVILAKKVVTPTLIFDEVDVGISGPTAAMVGNKLKQLGDSTQVICVTHLPQVASKGHQQLFVSKLSDGEITETKVSELNEQSRVREIARLLAGDSVTDTSLANAKELLAS